MIILFVKTVINIAIFMPTCFLTKLLGNLKSKMKMCRKSNQKNVKSVDFLNNINASFSENEQNARV